MINYTINFFIGEKVLDKITNKEATITGISFYKSVETTSKEWTIFLDNNVKDGKRSLIEIEKLCSFKINSVLTYCLLDKLSMIMYMNIFASSKQSYCLINLYDKLETKRKKLREWMLKRWGQKFSDLEYTITNNLC